MPIAKRFEHADPADMLAFVERVCENKKGYSTFGAALRNQHRMATTGKAKIAEVACGCEPYRCQFCGDFHLGHPTRTVPLGGRT
jgi:hypothetical protein